MYLITYIFKTQEVRKNIKEKKKVLKHKYPYQQMNTVFYMLGLSSSCLNTNLLTHKTTFFWGDFMPIYISYIILFYSYVHTTDVSWEISQVKLYHYNVNFLVVLLDVK